MGRSLTAFLSFSLLFLSLTAKADLRYDLRAQVIAAHHPISYDQAQVALLGNVGLIRMSNGSYAIDEVYCSTPYGETHLGNSVGPGKEPPATIINVEHTVAQSWFKGQSYFNVGKADLHHLYPSDSGANSMRGNYQFGEVAEIKNSPRCFDEDHHDIATESKLGTDSNGKTIFQPPSKHKGNIARAIFYFSVRYDFPIPATMEATLRRWNKLDPVDQAEMDRNNAIEKIQGNRNPFIDHPEYVDQISKF